MRKQFTITAISRMALQAAARAASAPQPVASAMTVPVASGGGMNLVSARRLPGGLGMAAVLPLLLGAGAAAAAAEREPLAAERGFALEEIVVTARKRTENLQNIPDAISVFTAKAIEDAGINTLNDVGPFIPNFTFVQAQDPGTALITVRGIGQVRNGEPPVAVLIDGVQVASAAQLNQDLFDVQQIEVLKGPQGSLYGRNAIGGAINITTKKPTNVFEGMAEGAYGNGDYYHLLGQVSGPVIEDKVFFRVAVRYADFKGLIENVTLHEKVDFSKETSVRGRLLVTPTERLSIDLRMFYSDADTGSEYYIPLFSGDTNDTSAQVVANVLGTGARDLQDYAAKIDYDAEFATLTSITSYSKIDNSFFGDGDFTPAPEAELGQASRMDAWGQEFRLTSPAERRLRWVLGASYLDTKRELTTTFIMNTPFGPLTLPIITKDHNKAYGIFGQASYDITEALELTLGLRWDSDKHRQTDVLMGGAVERTFDKFQPKVSLAYKLAADKLIYATFATGFRSGGFNVPSPVFQPLFKAETNYSYEVGFKTSWLENTLRLNGAGFYNRFDDQQFFFLRADMATGQLFQGVINIDRSDIYGFELELQARPFEGLDLNASVGYLDTKIKKFALMPEFIGNKLPLTEGWSYNLGAQYAMPVGDEVTVTARVDYRSNGDYFWYLDNLDKRKTLHIVDARLTAEWRHFAITGYATNLFQERYFSQVGVPQVTALPFPIAWPGEPRRYGVQVRATF